MPMATHQTKNTTTSPPLSSHADSHPQNIGRTDRFDRWDDALVSRQRQRYLASLISNEAHPGDSQSLVP